MVNNKTYLLFAVLFASLLVSGIVIADAQNYTLVILKINSDGNSLTYTDTDSFTAQCNGQNFIADLSSEDGEVTYLAFDANVCDSSSDVKITATQGNFKDNGELSVETCESDDDLCSSGNIGNVLNYAFGVLNLEYTAPVVKKSSSSSGSSAKKVVKNNTVMVVPIVSVENTPEIELATENSAAAPEETVVETTEEANEQTAPVTGGVIGALKSGAGIIAVVFIAGILVAYVYVRKRRNSYKGSYY